MKKIFWIACGCLFYASCQIKPDISKLILNFDSEKWKNDSLACLGERRKLAVSLDSQFNKIQGLKIDRLLDILGQPNLSKQENNELTFCYFVGAGLQCRDSLWHEKSYSDCEQINYSISIKGGVITGTTGVIYP